jgi:hypothetical protein
MQGKELFEISHGGRNIAVFLRNVGLRKRYIGSVNGIVCVIGSGKGDVMRRLIEVARHYPKADHRPVLKRQKRGGGRPRRVAPPWNSR